MCTTPMRTDRCRSRRATANPRTRTAVAGKGPRHCSRRRRRGLWADRGPAVRRRGIHCSHRGRGRRAQLHHRLRLRRRSRRPSTWRQRSCSRPPASATRTIPTGSDRSRSRRVAPCRRTRAAAAGKPRARRSRPRRKPSGPARDPTRTIRRAPAWHRLPAQGPKHRPASSERLPNGIQRGRRERPPIPAPRRGLGAAREASHRNP
jgi:hypothetical protein